MHWGRLFTDHGTPNIQVIEKLFNAIDENGNGYLCNSELRALVVGISLEEINLDGNDAIAKVLKDFDTSSDEKLDLKEFIAGVERWLYEARSSNGSSRKAGPDTMKYLDNFHEQTRMEHSLLGDASSGWKMVLHDESSQYYYWNIVTGEISWEVPPILDHTVEPRVEEKIAADTECTDSATSRNLESSALDIRQTGASYSNINEYKQPFDDIKVHSEDNMEEAGNLKLVAEKERNDSAICGSSDMGSTVTNKLSSSRCGSTSNEAIESSSAVASPREIMFLRV